MSVDLSQFFQTFFEEATDHLADMERLLLAMDMDSPDKDDLDSIFRAAHSIKGGAGIFGFQKLAGLTHILESHLDRLRKGTARMSEAIADELLGAVDYLRALLQACRSGQDPDEAEYRAMCMRFEHLGNAPELQAAAVPLREQAEDGSYGLFVPPVATEIIEGFGLFP
ncbi:Hpt domain-containing protein [Candidatus Dactylopiibacterium carminicum]|uniref:Hpt domain-containing protein n=1 Tax=Candidatus Dactylopiibacterium carminicum TaxID=857335 RepID=UPI001CC33002|nr:Hpt domain-containing protein [Candidatus Dactylopiibacterium carminicum]